MKKTLISSALAAVMGFAMLTPTVANAANAGDGTITFTGLIVPTTCIITGGGAASGTTNIRVRLPDVSVTALPAGNSAGDTDFSLILSGPDCTNGKTAALWIETTATPALDAATGALKNQASGGAGNVEVRMVNKANRQPINLAVNGYVVDGQSVIAANNQPTAKIVGNTATLNYVAQYLAVGGAATPGAVETYLTYSMQYN